MASQNIDVGASANSNDGDILRSAFIKVRKMFAEIYGQTYTGDTQDLSGTTLAIDSDRLAARYTDAVAISTYTGTVNFDCSLGFAFKLGGDLSGSTYTINLQNYKKGQVITIYPLKGTVALNLSAAGTSTNTFNKIGGVNFEDNGTSSNIIQIECVDDSATDPIFFYSLATYSESSSDI
jgi:hypothetical protein